MSFRKALAVWPPMTIDDQSQIMTLNITFDLFFDYKKDKHVKYRPNAPRTKTDSIPGQAWVLYWLFLAACYYVHQRFVGPDSDILFMITVFGPIIVSWVLLGTIAGNGGGGSKGIFIRITEDSIVVDGQVFPLKGNDIDVSITRAKLLYRQKEPSYTERMRRDSTYMIAVSVGGIIVSQLYTVLQRPDSELRIHRKFAVLSDEVKRRNQGNYTPPVDRQEDFFDDDD